MVIFLNTFQIPFSLFNYIISNSDHIVKTILQLFAFFCKLFKMKSECHGGLALLFSYPLSYQRGDHFHEPGGIHLILPSLFTYYYTEMVKACQVFSALFCIFFAITITAISSVKTKMRGMAGHEGAAPSTQDLESRGYSW